MGILVGLFSLLAVAVWLVFKDRARVNGKCLLNVIYSVPTAMDYVGFGGAPTPRLKFERLVDVNYSASCGFAILAGEKRTESVQ